MVIPELVTGTVEYDDDDDDKAHNVEGIQDEVRHGEFVETSYGHVVRLIDAIVVEFVQFSIDNVPIFCQLPLFMGPEVGRAVQPVRHSYGMARHLKFPAFLRS